MMYRIYFIGRKRDAIGTYNLREVELEAESPEQAKQQVLKDWEPYFSLDARLPLRTTTDPLTGRVDCETIADGEVPNFTHGFITELTTS